MSAQPEFTKHQLSFLISEFNNKTDNEPKQVKTTWSNFLSKIKQAVIRANKDGRLFSGATFDGTRGKENALELSLLVLDCDDGTTIEAITAKCKALGYSYALYTTFSHTPEKHKFRVVFPLATPIPANIYSLLWKWTAKEFPSIDPQPKSTASIFYYPAIQDNDAPFFAESFDGKLLDWKMLPLIELSEEPPKQQYQQNSYNYTSTHKAKSAYVQKALDDEVSKVRSATKGNRNGTLNNAAFALAQLLHTNLIDEITINTELESAGLASGLPISEVRATIKSGIAAGRKQPRIIPEKEFSSSYQRPNHQQTPPKQETEQPKTENNPKTKLGKSGLALMEKDFEPLRYCVDGIMPEGVTLLVGKSKIGKSAFALGVGASVATGGKALGLISVESRPVLYCALEDGERRLQDRLNKLLMGEKLGENFFYETQIPPLFNGGLELLEEWLQENKNALVVIDVLQKVRGSSLPGESVYDRDYRSIVGLKELAEKYRASILVLHHTRKADAVDFVDSINGSMGLSGAVDTILLLSRDRCKGDAKLSISGREVEERELALEFNFPSWKLLGDAEEVSQSHTRRTIIDILQKAGRPLSTKEVFEQYQFQDENIKYNNVKQRLYQMSKIGLVKAIDNGKYTLPISSHTHTHTNNYSNDDNYSNQSNQSNQDSNSNTHRGQSTHTHSKTEEKHSNTTDTNQGYDGYADSSSDKKSDSQHSKGNNQNGYDGYDGYDGNESNSNSDTIFEATPQGKLARRALSCAEWLATNQKLVTRVAVSAGEIIQDPLDHCRYLERQFRQGATLPTLIKDLDAIELAVREAIRNLSASATGAK